MSKIAINILALASGLSIFMVPLEAASKDCLYASKTYTQSAEICGCPEISVGDVKSNRPQLQDVVRVKKYMCKDTGQWSSPGHCVFVQFQGKPNDARAFYLRLLLANPKCTN
jgi:hypothetical protein